MIRIATVAAAALLVSGCSQGGGGASDSAGPQQAKAPAPAVPTRMAYSYSYSFNVPEAAVPTVQAQHAAMCDRLGLARCRVLETHRSTGEYGSASLKLEVASDIARRFGAGLAGPVEAAGGSLQSDDAEAEDIGRQIVDVEARLRAKETLVARLNALLQTRSGSVADLVTTEKAVSDAQGELDALRSQLRAAEGRIATSPIAIRYDRTQSFGTQVGDAFGAIGTTLSTSVVALIYFLSAALPWLLVGILAFFGIRAGLRRLRKRRTAPPA